MKDEPAKDVPCKECVEKAANHYLDQLILGTAKTSFHAACFDALYPMQTAKAQLAAINEMKNQ